jgi:cytochrome b involved in lipid metabolism
MGYNKIVMQNKLNTFLLGLVVLLLSFNVAYVSNTEGASNSAPAAPEIVQYKIAEVAMHNTQADCWTTINGSVYNVTNWIKEHPGGAKAIASLCGIDGSVKFNGMHAGQPNPAAALASFKIGTLIK